MLGNGVPGLDPAQVEALLAETVGPPVGLPAPVRGAGVRADPGGPGGPGGPGEPPAGLDTLGPRTGLRPPRG